MLWCVEDDDGKISIESEPNEGTVVSILFEEASCVGACQATED